MRRIALGALLAVAIAPAWAQDAPVTSPTRDVDIVYDSSAGARTLEQRSRFRAEDGKLRLDTPSPGLWMLVDTHARTLSMVSDVQKGVVDSQMRGSPAPGGFAPGQAFTRSGTATVAGLACTEWQTTDSQKQTVVACFTADGVLLRARRGDTVIVEAKRVTYGPLDPAVFAIPPSYVHRTAPERRP